jgi:hypothetical protein
MDPRVTMDRHGAIHLGEGQAVTLLGDDLGGVRWRTMQTLGESRFPLPRLAPELLPGDCLKPGN